MVRILNLWFFRRVYLATKQNEENQRKYAIKVISKQDIRRKNLIDQSDFHRFCEKKKRSFCVSLNLVLNERDALAIMHSQFVVRLFYSLQSREHIYLVMEYMIGGDLMSFLCIKQILNKGEARFYAAEIALALDYLHRRGVIHR